MMAVLLFLLSLRMTTTLKVCCALSLGMTTTLKGCCTLSLELTTTLKVCCALSLEVTTTLKISSSKYSIQKRADNQPFHTKIYSFLPSFVYVTTFDSLLAAISSARSFASVLYL